MNGVDSVQGTLEKPRTAYRPTAHRAHAHACKDAHHRRLSMQLDYQRLKACIGMRIPPAELFACDCTQLLPENVQVQVCTDLQPIIAANPYYVQTFLRRYLKLLEETGPIGEIYELICSPQVLQAKEMPPTEPDTLEYPINSAGDSVRIRETPRIISGAGTTGLRTWEAALFLSQYLLNGQDGRSLAGKKILELGAGTGLVSMALAKCRSEVGYMQVTVTDGDSELLERLPGGFAENGIHDMAASGVKVEQLVWGEDMGRYCDIAPDIVVAADVTYDAGIFPQLCDTLDGFLSRGTEECVVAATVRNPCTMEAWERALSRFQWRLAVSVTEPHQCGGTLWFRQGTPEIRVYSIKK